VGGTFKVPGIEGPIILEGLDIDREDFQASWTEADGSVFRFTKDQEIARSGISLSLIAFATWPERQAVASVTIRSGRAGDHSGEISVNHPMIVDGIRIYLTDYGRDKFGFPYVGFQFVGDPGQAGVWIGCVLFLVCLPGVFFIHHSCAVISREEGRLKVYISSRGNRDEVVRQLKEKLDPGAYSDV
jgi:hypothetical protein